LGKRIEAKLPNIFGRNGDVPVDLIGAEIIGFGTIENKPERGGLAIDYRPSGSTNVKRLELSFNEIGMWQKSLTISPNQDVSRESVCERVV
jgi:hypothetical protein